MRPYPGVSEQLGQFCLDFIEPAFSAASPSRLFLDFLEFSVQGLKVLPFP